jgi:DNA-binding CsgD family transcriptional regulator
MDAMTVSERPSMTELDRNASDLTDRQRFVLDLMTEGKTNPEIASRLEVSLNGAKWHVSEILTKLGLSSREEATAYWREHQRWTSRAARGVRALSFVPLWKPALGVVLLGVGLGAIWLGTSALSTSPKQAPVEFYMEGSIFQRREGNSFKLEPVENTPHIAIKWWFQDNQHFRQQFVDGAASGFDADQVVVADGDNVTYPIDGEYLQYPLACKEIDPHRLFNGAFLGLLPDSSIDELVRRLNSQGGSFRIHAATAGHEIVLGYDTTVVEYGPTWLNAGTSGGTGRIWIEPTHMVALRNTTEGNDGSEASRAEVTKLVFDGAAPASTFEPTLPGDRAARALTCPGVNPAP